MASRALAEGFSRAADFVTNYIGNQQKAALEEKLMRQRAELEDQYATAREQRAAAAEARKVATTSIIQRGDDFVRVSKNSYGQTISEEPVTGYERDKIINEGKKDAISLEHLAAQTAAEQARTDLTIAQAGDVAENRADRRRSLDIEEAQAASRARVDAAQAGYYNRMPKEGTSGGRSSASLDPNASGIGDAAMQLMAKYKSVWEPYTSGKEPQLTGTDVGNLAIAAIHRAGMSGKDVGQTFINSIDKYMEQPYYQNRTGSAQANGKPVFNITGQGNN